MHEVTRHNAAEYLRRAGQAAAHEPIEVRELAGGVSNVVLLVTLPARGQRFVLKQSRGQLRVKEEWLCPVERIWREVEVLRICGELLQARIAECGARNDAMVAGVPQMLWEDREDFLYAMTAAPPDHRTWKQMLLAGEISNSQNLAIACGRLLGQLHVRSWKSQEIAGRLDDRAYFEQLRLDPYYRQVARVQAELAPAVARLINSVWQHRCCVVHGDFSPKNLLVWPGHVMLIDFEVGHYGDPAFDLGFFLTHLVLKSIWAGGRGGEYLALATDFWQTYRLELEPAVGADDLVALEARMIWNLAGCLLARVDGKSPVDYLSSAQQSHVRDLATQWLRNPPPHWTDVAALDRES